MIAAALVFLITSPLHAQNFDSGSDGSDGAFAMSSDTTLDVPADGIFNFTTVTITGGHLSFRRNALNTPVFILATGDISITSADIIVSGVGGTSNPPAGGAGGPGGFDGGDPGVQDIPPGPGHGPGGAVVGGDSRAGGAAPTSAGAGAYATTPELASTSDGAIYGSPLLIPMVGGSGGGGGNGSGNGPGVGGSGGGGAVLLASNTRIEINGANISATGGNNGFPETGVGSGGAVRLVAPRVAGNATINVTGGGGVSNSAGDKGGAGRIRIDTIDRTGIRFGFNPLSSFSVGTFMAVFPPVVPTLALTQVAGQAIAGGAPVDVLLPFGTNPNQTVTVRATDFTGTVPIDVVLVPTSGERTVIPAQINMTSNPAQTTVNVTFPVNNRTRVWAWTR